tara:strand:- start:1418 stop:2971 length:1554 start_codon:yes stop_codon:yes gene_type:complete
MQIDLGSIGLNQEMIDRLASGDMYFGPRTPFTDWQQAASDLARESEEEVAERAIDLYSEVDPGRGRAMGGSTADLAYKEIVQEPVAESWMDTYKREGLSPYKVDPASGEKVYINTPAGVNLIDLLEGEDREEYLAKKEAGYDERLTKTPYNVETGLYGSGAGNYGTRVIPETPSKFQEVLSSPVASILSSFIPGGPALLTGAKVLSGSGRDIGLMEAAGAVAGATKLAGTPTATAVADNIEFTAAVASGDPALAVVSKYGKEYTTEALNKAGLTDTILKDDYNINQDDLVEGLVRTEKELVKGTSFDEALLKGLGTYVKEGGSLSGLPVPELNVVLETPELLKKAEDVLRTVGSVVDDTVLQPPKEFVEAVAESTPSPKVIEDIAREAGSTAEDVVRTAGAVIDEPVQVIKEAAESIYEPLEAPDFPSLEAPDLPSLEISTDVDLPSVDLDLPSVDLDIPAPSIGLSISQPQPTKGVTESLFEDFLFEKKYQAPELIARTVPLAQYTAPQGMFRNIV